MENLENQTNEIGEKSKKNLPKPYLLTRIMASFLDFFLACLLFVGFEATLYFTLFEPLGYHRLMDESQAVLQDSHLYILDDERGLFTITEVYDENLTPEENYDIPLTYYYTNDPRAIADNRLARYHNSKIVSGYFVEEGEGIFVRAEGADDNEVKAFFVSAYDDAIKFLERDPVYLNGVNKTFYIVIFTSLFSATLAMAIIHLLIPLLMKNGQTPFKLVFKLCIADARDDTRVKKGQVVVRFVILLLFNIWVPILLFARFSYFTLIPVFISIILMSLTKTFSGPHDYVAKTYIVSNRDIAIPEHVKVDEGDNSQ
ncbi:MAG: RDD family protein [Bacilli bacterium]|nr:RDD family protein [Bacilli bacterium]